MECTQKNEKGYTLVYTLIIMAIMLSLSAYLFAKVDLYRSLVESKKYAANTYLAAETLAISEGERIVGRFNKISGSQVMGEDETFQILSTWEQEYCHLYYTAKTCMEVTKSLFHTPSKDGYFYKENQVRNRFMIQADRKHPDFVLEVGSRIHPYNMQDISNPLKKNLANLEKIQKALEKIEAGIQKVSLEEDYLKRQAVLEGLRGQFDILKEEMLTKPLYEVESIAQLKKENEILNSQTLYLTLKLEKKAVTFENKRDGLIYYFTLPYQLETGYLKARKKSN